MSIDSDGKESLARGTEHMPPVDKSHMSAKTGQECSVLSALARAGDDLVRAGLVLSGAGEFLRLMGAQVRAGDVEGLRVFYAAYVRAYGRHTRLLVAAGAALGMVGAPSRRQHESELAYFLRCWVIAAERDGDQEGARALIRMQLEIVRLDAAAAGR